MSQLDKVESHLVKRNRRSSAVSWEERLLVKTIVSTQVADSNSA